MKHFLLTLLISLFCISIFGQGWRKDEMEIKVNIDTEEQASMLYRLKLNGDIYPGYARLFVTPVEVERIKSLNFDYEVLILDLNKHYENFWQTRDAYHSYDEIIELADSLVEHFPDICKKIIYGTSLGGRQLACLKISSNVNMNEIKPQVGFDGGIHGDEIGCSENVIRFARDLCLNYGNDPTITNLINTREIWLYLMVNPDGRVNMVRYNNNGVDLNRDWGYMWENEGGSTGAFSQIESKVLRDFVFENNFVVHTSYHSGTEYISCPWSYRASQPPDYNHILQLAGVYANVSGYSNMPYGQGYSGMYPINGSTKDSNYGLKGSVSWSLEISMSKQPPASQIMMYYNYNRPGMIAMIEYAGYGIRGIVTDAVTGEPVTASVFVNNFLPCFTDPENGDFHKYLTPGTYSVKVKANGYATTTVNNVVVTANNATEVNITLQPEDHKSIYRVISCHIPNNNPADPGAAWNVIGPPDNQYYSLGKNGWIVVDMQEMIYDGAGPDIIVFEGDNTPEGYTLYAGSTMDGPWHSMGTGSGTTEFDFANCTLSEARYFRVLDDGDGSANVNGAGFDLDAIQVLSSITGPYIIMSDYVVDDSAGNNNGQLDPGETATFVITLKNVGTETALDIIGSLTSSDEYITVLTTSPQVFGNIEINNTATAQYTVSASSSAPAGHTTNLNLEYAGTNLNSQVKTIPVLFPDYCYPTASCSFGDGFTGFSLEQINNMNSGCSNDNGISGYGDFTSMTTELQPGNTYTVSWKSGYSNQKASLWIDLDNDMGFSDNERLITDFSLSQSNTLYTTNFTLPESVLPGEKRLRIRANWQSSSSNPCSNFTYGETEDYTVIIPGNTLNAAFIPSVTEICHGDQVQFTDQSTGNITGWQWTFEGGTPSTSNLQNPLVTYQTPGDFDVSLTVTDGSNSNTYSQLNLIHVFDDSPVPSMPSGPSNLCQANEPTSYTSSAPNATSWLWKLEPAQAGTISFQGAAATVNWNESFSGSVLLSAATSNLCGESQYSNPLVIEIMPFPADASAIEGEDKVCQGGIDSYETNEIEAATSYEWILTPAQAGNLTSTENQCQIEWSKTYEGTASLKVRGSNECGFGNWSPLFDILVENCSGINKVVSNKIIIYPNPANGLFYVKTGFPDNIKVRITITNISGIKIYEHEGMDNDFTIDLKNVSNGIYYIKFETEEHTLVKKIMINQ